MCSLLPEVMNRSGLKCNQTRPKVELSTVYSFQFVQEKKNQKKHESSAFIYGRIECDNNVSLALISNGDKLYRRKKKSHAFGDV